MKGVDLAFLCCAACKSHLRTRRHCTLDVLCQLVFGLNAFPHFSGGRPACPRTCFVPHRGKLIQRSSRPGTRGHGRRPLHGWRCRCCRWCVCILSHDLRSLQADGESEVTVSITEACHEPLVTAKSLTSQKKNNNKIKLKVTMFSSQHHGSDLVSC